LLFFGMARADVRMRLSSLMFRWLEGSFVQAKVGGKRPSTSERFDLATHLRVSNYRSLGS
jgi:hypothetical protein